MPIRRNRSGKPRISRYRFQEIWNAAKDVEEVERKTGMSAKVLCVRASFMRNDLGMEMKKFSSARRDLKRRKHGRKA